MGYDISVRFKTTAERDNMLDFLEKQDWPALYAAVQHEFQSPVVRGEDLGAYAPQDCRDTLLGFSASILPLYTWMVCAWAATRSSYANKDGLPVLYHDDEELPVMVNPTEKTQHIAVDSDGVKLASTTKKPLFLRAAALLAHGSLDSGEGAVRDWIRSVNAQWEALQFNPSSSSPKKPKVQ